MGTVRTKFLDEALKLVSLGYHVFQCQTHDKKPFWNTAPKGCNSATGDIETVTRWWQNFPDCNIGLKCDNLLVLDIDNKNGKTGNADLQRMEAHLGPIQKGPVSLSGSGGYHLLFRKPDVDVKGTKGILLDGKKTGIDIQIGNQYIVVPPSIHPETKKAYRWMSPLCAVSELPELPRAWIEFLRDGSRLVTCGCRDSLQTDYGNSTFGSQHLQQNPLAASRKSQAAPIERCRAYLEKVPPCIAGQGGDTQLFKAASVIFWDFGLDEAEGMALLQEYNARCLPPWPESRLSYKMRQALESTHDRPRGHKLNENTIVPISDIDLSGILVQAAPKSVEQDEQEEADEPVDPGHVPESLLRIPGFVSEVMDFTLENSPCAVPTTAFCDALALQSFLCGRKVREPGDLRTNLYLLALAGASSGKDYPRKVNAHILYMIGEERSLGDKFVSGEGLQDSLFLSQNMLFQNDEIDGLLYSLNEKNRSTHVENIMGTLLTLYTSASTIYPMRRKSGKEHPGVVDQPHLTLFGTATPQNYYSALSERMLTNGFFARMIILDSDKRPFTPDASPVDRISDRVIETAKWWKAFQPGEMRGNLASFHPTPVTIPFDGDANEFMNDFRRRADQEYSAAEDVHDVAAMTVWGRANENARKLALLYACSENHRQPTISRPAAGWATEFVQHQIRRQLYLATEYASKSPFQNQCKVARRHLKAWHQKNGPHGMARWKLKRQLGVTPREFDDILIELEAQRYIKIEAVSTSGRPQVTISLKKS